jgi:uncharacterized membrane protein YphA (DoxX/SURF4 family)
VIQPVAIIPRHAPFLSEETPANAAEPLHDVIRSLSQPGWFTPVFWLLLMAGIALAVLAARADPAQRRPRAAELWGLRMLPGGMWWQQSLRKIPPDFADLRDWMEREAAHAAITVQGAFVGKIVLPQMSVFGPLVYLIEVAIGVSRLLGLLSRLGALPGGGDGPQSVARALFVARRMALDLYVPGDHHSSVFHHPPGRMPGADTVLRRAAGA